MGTLATAWSILRGDSPGTGLAVRQATKTVSYTSGGGYGGVSARPTTIIDHSPRDYSASAVAYRCVHYIASNLAAVDLTVVAGDTANDDHEVAVLWNRGTPGAPFSARTAREVVFSQAELVGEAFAYIDRGATGEGAAAGLWPIFDPVSIVVRDGALAGFIVKVGANTGGERRDVPLLPSEMLWLRYPDPFSPWGALAPWKAALYAVESDSWARAWQQGEFRNGARPSHVIFLGAMDDEGHAEAKQEYRTEIEGPGNAGKAFIISSSVDAIEGTAQPAVHRLSLTPAEMSYLESRTANAEEVMLAFGLRPDLFRGQSTYENQRAAKTAAWSDRLLPALDVLGSELDRQLLPDPGMEAGWDLSTVDALQENTDSIYNRLRGIAYTDVLTLDEMRADLGHDPLPGGLGALTLTAYRKALDVAAAQELAAAADDTRALFPTPRRVVRLASRRATVFPRQRLAPAPTKLAARGTYLTRAGLTPKRVLALYDRHERVGVKAVARLAARQEKAVLRELRKQYRVDPAWLATHSEHAGHRVHADPAPDGRSLAPAAEGSRLPGTGPCPCTRVAADDVFDPSFWRDETQQALDTFLTGTWVEGGQRAADGMGLSWETFDPRVIAAMEARSVVLADQVTRTTRAVLDAQLLAAGVEGGEDVEQLADRIRSVFADLSSWRATTIARTETVGGFNAAAHVVATESGLTVARTWLATEDDRTRRTHRELDGVTVRGTTAPFPNGLMHPGDPAGPARETVNCRCVELFDTED